MAMRRVSLNHSNDSCSLLTIIGILLTTPTDYSLPIPKDSHLRFLSVVDVAQLPVHILLGQQYNVSTNDHQAQKFLERTLLACSQEHEAWWKTIQPESPWGILVAVDRQNGFTDGTVRITELLLVASRFQALNGQRLATPPASSPFENAIEAATDHQSGIQVLALAMSSDLLHPGNLPSPPLSPTPDDSEIIPGTFLPSRVSHPTEVIHEPPTKKRRTATSTLDEATARRAAARRSGGEGISAAAAAKPEVSHRRTSSNTPLQTRPLSRSPSITSSRPVSVRGPSTLEKQPSTLSRVQSLSALPQELPSEESAAAAATEAKNKDIIARVVMAGMRLYGLAQSSRKLRGKQQQRSDRTASPAPLPEDTATPQELEAERKSDEEYKAVYHQVYKGVCFTFRAHMQTLALQGYTEPLREAADKLLALYCCDPLAQGLLGDEEKFTPGGRKAYGSAKVEAEGKSPFDVGRSGTGA